MNDIANVNTTVAKGKVLLARPHPFIASAMRGTLVESGFGAVALSALDELHGVETDGISGAVISTSITASDSAVDVLRAVRERFPGLPVIVATLLDFDMTRRKLEAEFAAVVSEPKFLPVSNLTLAESTLGARNLFPIVHKNDLEQRDQQKLVEQIMNSHFR